MIKLQRPVEPIRNIQDVHALRSMMERLGYHASYHDIDWAYREMSQYEFAAGWIALDTFNSVADAALKVVEYLERA